MSKKIPLKIDLEIFKQKPRSIKNQKKFLHFDNQYVWGFVLPLFKLHMKGTRSLKDQKCP